MVYRCIGRKGEYALLGMYKKNSKKHERDENKMYCPKQDNFLRVEIGTINNTPGQRCKPSTLQGLGGPMVTLAATR